MEKDGPFGSSFSIWVIPLCGIPQSGISIKRNALPGILTEVLLFLNPDECAKIKPIRAEGKGENHVYDCRTGESRERI